MKLAKIQLADGEKRIATVDGDEARLLDLTQVENCYSLSDILHSPDPLGLAKFLVDPHAAPIAADALTFLAPIDEQEVWAAGVTYKRSQVARMEESETGASHYDRVYTADRPELFFKATPSRVVGPEQDVRVRADSDWSVPEPEFALVISPELELVGYTIGNDMSARDIEGENPLYLPQAKLYRQCCALGPTVLLAGEPLDLSATKISVDIERGDSNIFSGETNLGEMARNFEDLIGWLGRDNDFPDGAILLTGTGIVPPDDLALEDRDRIIMNVTGIGTLINRVTKQSSSS